MTATKENTQLSDLKVGDLVEVTGLTCLMDHTRHPVKADSGGRLYLDCADGEHMLDHQTVMAGPWNKEGDDTDETLVGVKLVIIDP